MNKGDYMPWISENRYLTQAEKENNANIIIAYYRAKGLDDRTIARNIRKY